MDGAMHGGDFTHNNTTPPKSKGVLSLFSLKHKTAIVSGAGAGIGFAVVKALAEAGANVAIWYNSNKEAEDKAAAVAKEYGVLCKAYQCDVTSLEEVKKVTNKVVEDFNGRLDIFVANAGIPWTQGAMLTGDVSLYRKVFEIDVDGIWYCAIAAGEIWRRQAEKGTDIKGNKLENYRYGSFVATASMSGHVTNIPQLQTAYNAAKAAVLHMCKGLAVEWVKFARVNTVSPGYINTELTKFVPPETKNIWRDKIPMGREGLPEELQGAFLYLASDAASYTTGTDIIVDGGYCLP